MSQYVSKFSGVDIDRAVAYYNDMQRIGRTILQVPITTEGGDSPWQSTAGTPDSTIANYYIDITANGVNTIASNALDFPPQVYFLDESGLRWEVEYRFAVVGGANCLRCFSNAQKDGTIVIVSILSNAIVGGDSSFDSDLTVRHLTVIGTITQPDVVSSSNN